MRTYKHPDINSIELADILHALGDSMRLKIIKTMIERDGPLNCTAIGQIICSDCAPSTCNHNLRILREAGLIHSTRKGLSVENVLRRDDLETKFPGLLASLIKYSK